MTPEESKARKAQWWKDNREKAAAYRRNWRLKDPERTKEFDLVRREKYAARIKAYNAAYARKNKEKLNERNRAWRAMNPEKNKLITRLSHQKHPEIMVNAKAKRRKAIGEDRLSYGLTRRLMISQNGCCNYCKRAFGETTPHRDHIEPIALGGRNHDSNIQLLCRPCNQLKGPRRESELNLTELIARSMKIPIQLG